MIAQEPDHRPVAPFSNPLGEPAVDGRGMRLGAIGPNRQPYAAFKPPRRLAQAICGRGLPRAHTPAGEPRGGSQLLLGELPANRGIEELWILSLEEPRVCLKVAGHRLRRLVGIPRLDRVDDAAVMPRDPLRIDRRGLD
jgi:hypothetical protein